MASLQLERPSHSRQQGQADLATAAEKGPSSSLATTADPVSASSASPPPPPPGPGLAGSDAKSDLGAASLAVAVRLRDALFAQLKSPSPWFVYSILFTNQIIFSGLHVFSKPALKYIKPFVFATLRIACSLPFIRWLAEKEGGLHKTASSDTLYFVALGAFGVALPQGLIFVGNALAGPAVVAIFQPSIPVWVAAFSAALKLEKMTIGKGVGVASAVGGALLLLGADGISEGNTGKEQALGTLVMIIQSMAYSVYLVMLQWKLRTFPYPITIFYNAMKYGLCAVAFVALFFIKSSRWSEAPFFVWVAIVYCGIVVSFLAHSANSWAVRHVAAVTPALFTCLQPFISMLGATLFLGMSVRVRDLGGLALILAGVLLVIFIKTQEMKRQAREAAVRAAVDGGAESGTKQPRLRSSVPVFSFTTLPVAAYNKRTPLGLESMDEKGIEEEEGLGSLRERGVEEEEDGEEGPGGDLEAGAPPPVMAAPPPPSRRIRACHTGGMMPYPPSNPVGGAPAKEERNGGSTVA